MTKNDKAALAMLRRYFDLHDLRTEISNTKATHPNANTRYEASFRDEEASKQMALTWQLLKAWHKGGSVVLARLAVE